MSGGVARVSFFRFGVDPISFLDELGLLLFWKRVLKPVLQPVLNWMASIAFVWRRRRRAFASHRRRVSLLTVMLVAQPLDLGQDEIPHPRMFDSEWDFDEEHVGSSTQFSLQ